MDLDTEGAGQLLVSCIDYNEFVGRIGIGKIGAAAMEAIARQPESAGDIRSNMIVIAALIEGVALFGVIVCVLSLFI